MNTSQDSRKRSQTWTLFLGLVSLLACGPTDPPPNTGGTTVKKTACGRGLVVIQSDYQSTNVSLIGVDGQVLSSSFLSSASTSAALSSALSGDVVVPTSAMSTSEIVLLNRYPNSVLTWVDVTTAQVRAQLNVGTGFASNPQDYLQIDEHKAYVSRFEANGKAGEQAFDQGSDLLIIDPTTPAITGRIDLSSAAGQEGFLPRPSGMVAHGDHVVVLLGMYDPTFTNSLASRLVTINSTTDQIEHVLDLEDHHGCSGLAIEHANPSSGEASSPRLAVSCSGRAAGASMTNQTDAGVVLLNSNGSQLEKVANWPASVFAEQSPGWWLDFVDAQRLAVNVFGQEASSGVPLKPDAIVELDFTSDASKVVVESQDQAFTLGDVRCAGVLPDSTDEQAGCGRCFATDAERGVVHILDGNPLQSIESIVVDEQIGLPPRSLGRF